MLLRSTEIKPWFCRFVPSEHFAPLTFLFSVHSRGTSPRHWCCVFWACRGVGEEGRGMREEGRGRGKREGGRGRGKREEGKGWEKGRRVGDRAREGGMELPNRSGRTRGARVQRACAHGRGVFPNVVCSRTWRVPERGGAVSTCAASKGMPFQCPKSADERAVLQINSHRGVRSNRAVV